MVATSGRIVQTRNTKEPYKVILEHGFGESTEHPVSTMRKGEAFIKQETPDAPEPDTTFDR